MEQRFHGIELTGLTKQYGYLTAVNNVSLQLPWGNFLSLFGRNGAGKTTLLRILASLLKPGDGAIRIDGEDVTHTMSSMRGRVGFVSHLPMFYGDLTAAENLQYYARLYGIGDAERIIAERLDRVGMLAWARSPVRSFSRGMQQRLAIARAFLHRPRLLLLDEPFSGLDQGAIRLLKGMLAEFKSPENAVILTTHQLEEGWEVADMIAVLEKGRLQYVTAKSETDFISFRSEYESLQQQ